jgi:predicted PhzF superfamily epimerase YddE/YHI9
MSKYVYAPIDNNQFYARDFKPRTGHAEDGATWVAAAALAGSLKKSLTIC